VTGPYNSDREGYPYRTYDGIEFNAYGHLLTREAPDGSKPSDQATETQEQRPTKQGNKTMTPIRISKPTMINDSKIEHYSAADRSLLLQQHETEIKRLEALEFKTQETKDEIAALRAGIVAAIAEFDADYAARRVPVAAK